MLSNECHCIKIDKLLKVLTTVRNDQRRILYMLGKLDVDCSEFFNFPLQTKEDLEELENNLAGRYNAAQFSAIISKYKPPDKFKYIKSYSMYGLCKFINSNLLFEFNWNGVQGKKPFKIYTRLNDILYNAWRGKYINSYYSYIQNIKHQLLAVRGRINSKNSLLKRKCNLVI